MRIHTLLLVCCAVLLTGCFEEITKVYDGPSVVEFEQYNQPHSGDNYTADVVFPFEDEDDGVITFDLRLNLITAEGMLDSESYISFQADEDETTAEEGVDYSLSPSDQQAVFPANEVFSNIEVELTSADLEPGGEGKTLVIELVDGDVLSPAENYKRYEITFSQEEDPGDGDE